MAVTAMILALFFNLMLWLLPGDELTLEDPGAWALRSSDPNAFSINSAAIGLEELGTSFRRSDGLFRADAFPQRQRNRLCVASLCREEPNQVEKLKIDPQRRPHQRLQRSCKTSFESVITFRRCTKEPTTRRSMVVRIFRLITLSSTTSTTFY